LTDLPPEISNNTLVVSQSQKIAVCSNFAKLQCYNSTVAAMWQHSVLSSVSRNKSGLLKFCYVITPL
jgi:hypothetical protein